MTPRRVAFPYSPMEAKSVDELPTGTGWQFEPKWDGFRCIAFRKGKRVRLQSKSGRPLERFFPEVVAMLLELKAKQFVLDGEIVVPIKGRFSFDDLLMRMHTAASRVAKLSRETPARYIVFDLLVDESGASRVKESLLERRKALVAFARRFFPRRARLGLSPATRNRTTARTWLMKGSRVELDGVIAKRADEPYHSGDREGMVKVKRRKSADCVVGGFRYATNSKIVGSLLLGLYDRAGLLNHVGFTSGISLAERRRLTPQLRKLIKPPGFTGNTPGKSRWNSERAESWEPLAPKLVVEVLYDQVTSGRFRHGTRLLRWRGDKAPKQCTMEQIT
jgi:ATP-dependent DNA ligase